MLGSTVLETAIGLVFLFLGVSLITTALQEFLASAFRLRARTLKAGLKDMIAEGQQGLSTFRALMKHPLVAPTGQDPSYLSAEQFSMFVIHTLGGAGAIPTSVSSLRIAALNMPESPLKAAIVTMFREGEISLDNFEARLKHWFDQGMDRVSGDYKRLSQYISFVLGALIAFALQINAIGYGIRLWHDQALRADAIAGAVAALKNSNAQLANVQSGLAAFQIRPLWEFPPAAGALPVWIIGCFITAVAVTLGAPFWFDLLQRFVNLRGTGPAPASGSAGVGVGAVAVAART